MKAHNELVDVHNDLDDAVHNIKLKLSDLKTEITSNVKVLWGLYKLQISGSIYSASLQMCYHQSLPKKM